MLSCIWYISKNISAWERALIGNMASALKSRAEIIIYADGGVNNIKYENAYSWQALTSLERAKNILFSGKRLWHLWGDAPAWWPLVKLHARTAHTLNFNFNFNNKNFKWQGCPSRLFPDDRASSGEFILIPNFDFKLNNNVNQAEAPAVYASDKIAKDFDLNIKLDGNLIKVININNLDFNSQAKSGVFIADSLNIYDALKAAVLTMQGLAVVSLKSEYLDKLLGSDGYFKLDLEDGKDARREIILKALSEQGRRVSASARHFIKSNYSSERCADSFLELYKNILKF